MKSLRILAVSAAVLAAGSTFAADQTVVTEEGVGTFSFFKPSSVRLEAGTTGLGGAVSYGINQKWGTTLGYAAYDDTFNDIQLGDNDYDVDLDVTNGFLTATYRPFAGNFGIDFGTYYQDNKIKGTVTADEGTTFTYDNKDFVSPAGGLAVAADVKYQNELAPFVGLSYSPSITQRFGLFGQIGVMWAGKSDIKLAAVKGGETVGSDGRTLKQVVADEEKNIQDDFSTEFLPVAKVGLQLRF